MSRAVVIGAYPPTGDPAAVTTVAEVRALRASGHDVLVISPEPSAARLVADPGTRRGARRIARLVRGADVVVWVGPRPPDAVARVLRDVPDVRTHTTPARSALGPGVATRVALLRAGVPTFVRGLRRAPGQSPAGNR